MKTIIINPPPRIYNNILDALKRGDEVVIKGIGTIYASEYKKKEHPIPVGGGKYKSRPIKLTRLNFRPDVDLKDML